MKAKAILIIGMPGSGKDEFAMVARDMGIEVINMGDIVRKYTSSTGVSISMSGEIASRERKANGMDIWAKRTIERSVSQYVIDLGSVVWVVDHCFLYESALYPRVKILCEAQVVADS